MAEHELQMYATSKELNVSNWTTKMETLGDLTLYQKYVYFTI
jgi:hypothetical protein